MANHALLCISGGLNMKGRFPQALWALRRLPNNSYLQSAYMSREINRSCLAQLHFPSFLLLSQYFNISLKKQNEVVSWQCFSVCLGVFVRFSCAFFLFLIYWEKQILNRVFQSFQHYYSPLLLEVVLGAEPSPEILLTFLLTSSTRIILIPLLKLSARMKEPLPPKQCYSFQAVYWTLIWFCQCSVHVSGLWKALCLIRKFTGRKKKLQSHMFAITKLGIGGFLSFLRRIAVSTVE